MNELPSRDIRFLRTAVRLRYCSRSTAEKAAETMRDLYEAGGATEPDLRKVMLENDWLSREAVEAISLEMARGQGRASGGITGAVPADLEIPGYKLVTPLRAEPNGIVYKAHQESLDRYVALKVLHEELAGNFRTIRKFINEAKTASKLNHANIIRVHEVGSAQGTYFYTTEYVHGYPLPALLAKLEENRLSPRIAGRVFAQVARALEYGALHHVIHRELRPETIFVGDSYVTKIANLGLISGEESRFLKGNNPYYVAPEQVEKQTVTFRTDLYCMGAVMYYALTGTPPYSGRTQHEILTRRLVHPPRLITEILPKIPKSLASLVGLLMRKEAEARPGHTGKVAAELENMADGDFTISDWLKKQLRKSTPAGTKALHRRRKTGSERHRR